VLGSYPLRKAELLAPFAQAGQFQQLKVECIEISALPDAPWTRYERDGDRETLATTHARFFRTIFMPSLAAALTRVRTGDPQAVGAFADRLEHGLKQRLAAQPAAMHSFVQTIVLAKQFPP